ncbi:protein phosphatase [Deinococcus reticulitermitis]|uniref:Protein phosphatase n=1 Tax=Deinococcus reticulitermitis TaxID=856736 RepID=A0A1H6YA56_9DEIO|nr:AAA family ATPase [Deinococcus reticulitermitis]SEJ38183.1 protein phosphatase [Deinococcus reticulitermitis]
MTGPETPPQAPTTDIRLPELCLVALIGAAGAGKSTFAARHFGAQEVLSGDVTQPGAFQSLLEQAGERLAHGRLTVLDAAAVRPEERRRMVALARAHDVEAVALVLDPPRALLEARYAEKERDFPAAVIGQQYAELRRTQGGLNREGFGHAWVLRTPQEVEAARVTRAALPVNRRDLTGPFDLIGDVHGCLGELRALLLKLGYEVKGDQATPPPGRTAAFLGDLVDRGPDSAGVLRLVMNMVASGAALCVPGNHDEKLARALEGKKVQVLHGLDATLTGLEAAGPDFGAEVRTFLEGLPSHLVLDGGRLVAAHAGLPERYQGRESRRVRRFALYGDVDGRTDDLGLPVRGDWAAEYRGEALVVYGHTPVAQARRLNRTVNIDTGCAFGGALSALRYPELEVVSVPAHAQYAVASRPLPTA